MFMDLLNLLHNNFFCCYLTHLITAFIMHMKAYLGKLADQLVVCINTKFIMLMKAVIR